MNCSEDLIEGYLDEELDAPQRADVEQHLAVCPSCSEACARLRRQKARIKASAPYYAAPPELRQSIRGALEQVEAGKVRGAAAGRTPWRWLAIAASLLLAASASWNLLQLRSAADRNVVESVVGGHIRSLLGDHLMDVASTDQHTVKPWFAGKLDFSPVVKDFEAQGFRLAGGRVDYLAGRRVAALVYRRRQHVINLFTWPGSSGRDTTASLNGYNVLSWTAGSMKYWAVSDAAAGELESFRALFK